MSNAFPKILTVAAAAAFLAVTPVYSQTSGTGTGGGAADVVPMHEFDQRVTPEHRTTMGTAFRAMQLPPAATDVTIDLTPGVVIPETLQTHPLPPEIVEAVPDTRGYEYVNLADGRIALVHPQDRTIVTILD